MLNMLAVTNELTNEVKSISNGLISSTHEKTQNPAHIHPQEWKLNCNTGKYGGKMKRVFISRNNL